MGNNIVEAACISSIFHEKGEILKLFFAARATQLMWLRSIACLEQSLYFLFEMFFHI